ncbi:MAG: YggU family protein [Deltaproteobacteria bacterium]|nr:YggU family protein [Deltaproteobacteria bacterium]
MSGAGLDIREGPDGITFNVLVVPRASRERVGPVVGDRLKVAVTAPPVEGEANAAVVALLARALGVSRRQVEIVGGESSKRKTVRVLGVGRDALLKVP